MMNEKVKNNEIEELMRELGNEQKSLIHLLANLGKTVEGVLWSCIQRQFLESKRYETMRIRESGLVLNSLETIGLLKVERQDGAVLMIENYDPVIDYFRGRFGEMFDEKILPILSEELFILTGILSRHNIALLKKQGKKNEYGFAQNLRRFLPRLIWTNFEWVCRLKRWRHASFSLFSLSDECKGNINFEDIRRECLYLSNLSSEPPNAVSGNEAAQMSLLLAETFLNIREWERALEHYRKAFHLFHANKEFAEIGQVSHRMGVVNQALRNWEVALECYQQALDNHSKFKREDRIGITYHQMGMVQQLLDKPDEAMQYYEKALDHLKSCNKTHLVGSTLHQIGMIYEGKKMWNEALVYYRQATSTKLSTGMHHLVGSSYHQMGMVYEMQKQWSEALDHYQQSVEANLESEMHQEIGATFHQMAMVYQRQEKWGRAMEYYEKALEQKKKSFFTHEMGSTKHQIGMVHQLRGDYDRALDQYQESLVNKQAAKMDHQIGPTFHQLGIVLYRMGRLDEALDKFEMAIKHNIEENLPRLLCEPQLMAGRLLRSQGKRRESVSVCLMALQNGLKHLESEKLNQFLELVFKCLSGAEFDESQRNAFQTMKKRHPVLNGFPDPRKGPKSGETDSSRRRGRA